jgi:hypothetical protein
MYEVRFYKGNYKWRQLQANRDRCAAYVEHHFNAASSSRAGYSVVVTGYNASDTSKKWGRWYANRVGQVFNVPVGGRGGILVGGYNGRGNGNLKHTHMPAILLEPLFVSNPQHAQWVRSEDGQNKLANILANSIIEFFPNGSRIGFSVGHKYKSSRPSDRGAAVHGGGTEADYAEIVMEKAKVILEKYDPASKTLSQATEDVPDNDIRVVKDGKELWTYKDVDEDDYIMWDEINRILYIKAE